MKPYFLVGELVLGLWIGILLLALGLCCAGAIRVLQLAWVQVSQTRMSHPSLPKSRCLYKESEAQDETPEAQGFLAFRV